MMIFVYCARGKNVRNKNECLHRVFIIYCITVHLEGVTYFDGHDEDAVCSMRFHR